jgi:GT2 family glycosyltransferase
LLAENYNYATKSFEEGGVKADWKEMEFYVTKDEREINILSTRGLMMRISDFISLKGFHPLLIPHYLSDYEFSFRAFKKGFTLLTSPDYFLYYNASATRNVIKDVQSFYSLMKYRLSRKSPGYIIAWTSFVILCCPLKYKIKHLVKLWLFPILYFLVPLKKKFVREYKGFL